MKTILSISLIVVTMTCALTGYAQSTGGLLDERFTKANQWLRQENLSITKTPKQAFVDNYIIVEGEGLPSRDAVTPGQKRLTAQRAAHIVAYGRLAEIIDGLAVVGESSTKDLALKYDVIRTAVNGFIKGAQVIYKEYDEEDEAALVLIKIGVTGPDSYADVMYTKLLKDPKLGRELEDKTKQPFKPAPVIIPVEINYDSLIIDTTGLNFRPALINRIYTEKGEILYDPSKISQKVLIEHSCGEYTNSVTKARAALELRGAKNPLIIKASGIMNPSDLRISDDDAVKVFSANQKGNFLNDAKVAFVLK